MERLTLAETIKEITRRHLAENNGMLLGQAISAVGWVNGTVPDTEGIIELPMTDVAGAGFAVGAAMVGRRPIFVLRFQDFLILNGSPLINYAARCKELHGQSAPVFIRALAHEGIGPVHSNVLHGMFMHFPGFRICSPMTPGEYQDCWHEFMDNDDPMLVSEHRDSFQNKDEFTDIVSDDADITLYGISSPRLHLATVAARLANDGIKCNIVHIVQLKPFAATSRLLKPLQKTGFGVVIDAGFEICGASRSIAYELMDITGLPVKALGIQDKVKCLCPPYQNKAPGADRIYEYVKENYQQKNNPSEKHFCNSLN